MLPLLLALLLQAEPTIDDRIAAFVKGAAAARAELVKLGVYAIRPLQKARDKSPEKIGALLWELKKAAATPAAEKVLATLEAKSTIEACEGGIDSDGEVRGDILKHLGRPLYLMRAVPADGKAREATVTIRNRPLWEAIDQFSLQTGLDFAVYHRTIIVGPAERLWPAGPPPAPKVLSEDDLKQARLHVEKLNAGDVAERTAAERELMRLGPGVVKTLEAQLTRSEGEIVARCRALIRTLARKPAGPPFGPSSAVRQTLAESDQERFKHLKGDRITHLRLRGVSLSGLVNVGLRTQETPFRFGSPEVRLNTPVISYIDASGLSALDFLSVITQGCGLDFAIIEGELVIDTPEALAETCGIDR